MRILRIIPTIDPEAGGPSTTVVNSVVAETRAGADVTFCATFGKGIDRPEPAVRRLDAEGVEVRMFPRLPWPSRAGLWALSPRLVLWMVRHMRSFDVVHLNYVWCLSTVLGSILGRLYGLRVILTPHESLTSFDVEITSGGRLKSSLKKMLRRMILTNVDLVVYASDLERGDSQSVPHASVLVPHPVADRLSEAPAPEPPGDVIHLAYLGRIHPKKNLKPIIESLAELNSGEDSQAYDLAIAGRGDIDLEDDLKRLADELGVERQITWLGLVDAEGREQLFRSSHLLVMPSRYESFGMSAAESMAAGVPPIVTRSTGVASLVEEFGAGVVIPDPSVANLTRAIRELAADPAARAELRLACLRAVDERLTYDAYATEIVRLSADPVAGTAG